MRKPSRRGGGDGEIDASAFDRQGDGKENCHSQANTNGQACKTCRHKSRAEAKCGCRSARGQTKRRQGSTGRRPRKSQKDRIVCIRRLSPMGWKSGDNLWLMDMIAPFGGQDEAMKELREKIFPGRKIKTLQPAPSGEGMAVVEW